MSLYFITADAADEISAVLAKVTTDDIKAAEGFHCESPKSKSEGGTVTIDVKGPMFPTRHRVLSYLGVQHAAYDEIKEQIAAAEEAGADKIVFAMDSPGGAESGLYSMMRTVAGTSIPTETHVGGKAASAGYFFASQTGAIIADNPTNIIGSVGLVQSAPAGGAIEITNPESPNKRIDASTPEGMVEAQKPLSDLFAIYAEQIAAGRGVSADDVKNNYGKGAIMSARTALKSQMIDAIGTQETQQKNAGVPAENRRSSMNREQLKAENPELFASLIEEGRKAAKTEYVEHAKAHMDLAAMSEDYERAAKDMSEMTACGPQAMSHHTTQAVKKNQIAAREEENSADLGQGEGDEAPAAEKTEAAETKEVFAATGFEVDCE